MRPDTLADLPRGRALAADNVSTEHLLALPGTATQPDCTSLLKRPRQREAAAAGRPRDSPRAPETSAMLAASPGKKKASQFSQHTGTGTERKVSSHPLHIHKLGERRPFWHNSFENLEEGNHKN